MVRTYLLYNEQLKKPLIHPKVGLWSTNNREEADDLLKSCHEYVKSIGREDLIPFLTVKEIVEVI